MVKIAVAGGTGNVATELLRTTINSGKHSVTVFTRGSPSSNPNPNVTYKKVDYSDRGALTKELKGFDVCLSFMVVHLDENNTAQKNLIHASIDAGVKRFMPSEWGIKSNSPIREYANKDTISAYLQEINKEKKVLEYSLFQPSIFMDYFAHPHPLSPGLHTWPFFIDYNTRHAIILDSGEQPIVLTAVQDDSNILALALEDSRPWPPVGGVRGCRTTINELLALGKKLRPGEWTIEHVKGEDIMKDELKTEWVPTMTHPVIPVDKRDSYSKTFTISFLKGILSGSWDVSQEWNERFPEYKFVGPEEYLEKAWEGKA